MKIKIKRTPERLALVQAMASRNSHEANEAREAVAAFIGPVIEEVINQAAVSSLVYEDQPYNFDESPSIPLEIYDDAGEGFLRIWAQDMPGGLPSNLVSGTTDYKIGTYNLDSAISFLEKYARQSRLDVVSQGMERMAQELIAKIEDNAWNPILKALADSSDDDGNPHLYDVATTDIFQVDDLNTLWTKAKRLNKSWLSGTPSGLRKAMLTDIVVSPEVLGQIRGFSYNPMNTRGVPNSDESTALGLPENVREEIFRSAGAPEIFGIRVNELYEFGVGQSYNTVFDTYYSGGSPAFDNTADELVLGLDLSSRAFVRAVAVGSDEVTDSVNETSVVTEVDDQFVRRQKKIGFYTSIEEGRVVLSDKAVLGLVV